MSSMSALPSNSSHSTSSCYDITYNTTKLKKIKYDPVSLAFVTRKIVRLLDIKDRRYRLRVYKSCFVCSDVVDLMVEHKMVNSREEGVELGIALQIQSGLWKHVLDDHVFSDSYLFFKLRSAHCPTESSNTDNVSEEDDDDGFEDFEGDDDVADDDDYY